MRQKSIQNCIEILGEYNIDFRSIDVLSIGPDIDESPFRTLCSSYVYIGELFNDKTIALALYDAFELTMCFGVLNQVRNPFDFVRSAVRTVGIGDHIYLSGRRSEIDKDDLFFYKPKALESLLEASGARTLYSFWETDGIGVAILGERVE